MLGVKVSFRELEEGGYTSRLNQVNEYYRWELVPQKKARANFSALPHSHSYQDQTRHVTLHLWQVQTRVCRPLYWPRA